MKFIFGKLIALSMVTALILNSETKAAVTGFGNNGTGWTQNGDTVISNDVLTLTHQFEPATSAFFNTQQDITNFHTTFIYQASNPQGLGYGDGITFAIQTQGPTALGEGGYNLGYGGIPGPSAAFAMNIYSPNTVGVNLWTNGNWGGINPVSPVQLQGDSVLVTLDYNAGIFHASLKDLANSETYVSQYTISLPGVLGKNNAYIGFTGGDWYAVATQNVSSFSFTSVPEPSTLFLLGMGAIGLLLYIWKMWSGPNPIRIGRQRG